MQTFFTDEFLQTDDGQEVNRILRSCVHCGFCTATCPTYQLLGDELDGPRGRIYLIKGLFEGEKTTTTTQTHLDRCLTCRACETSCPSGVEYGHLLDIGRTHLEKEVSRRPLQAFQRFLLRKIIPHRLRFKCLLRIGKCFRMVLPTSIKKRIPPFKFRPAVYLKAHDRKVILVQGCVQSSLSPETNQAVIRLLDRLGIESIRVKQETCCGALDYHLGATGTAREYMKQNIDAWWPLVETGVESIVSTASGCGVLLKDYAYVLRDDPEYAHKAGKISSLVKDTSEIFNAADIARLKHLVRPHVKPLVFQCPCTLQHGQKLAGKTERLLADLGFELEEIAGSHLCCGSAGVYSILQPDISGELRKQKINALLANNPGTILTANIGCQMHLQQATDVPVIHWVEIVDAACG